VTVPTVVVSTGTYHLPFDRLADWMGAWRPQVPARIVFQHGVGRPLAGAENHRMLAPDGLLDLYRAADAVVLQGGAGGVMDARAAGRIPLVVPRVPSLGEVVDDHQIRFATELGRQGVILLCDSQAALHETLDGVLAGRIPSRMSAGPTPGAADVVALLSAPIPRVGPLRTVRRAWRMAVRRA
jgi:UDP-N-acetylglucosamine transferase subunit ALG13